MNSWNFTGDILGHGIRGKKFPILWVRVGLDLVKIPDIDGKLSVPSANEVFVNIDLPETGPTARMAKTLQEEIDGADFLFIEDATIAPIKRSRKSQEDEWESYEERGIRAKPQKTHLLKLSPQPMNSGIVVGKVLQQQGPSLIIEERYRNIATNEWKVREVPVMHKYGAIAENMVGKRVFVRASISGKMPDGRATVFAVSQDIIWLT